MNYLSDEWLDGQMAELEQHRGELLNAIAEVRQAAGLVAKLRAAVEVAHLEVGVLRDDVATLTASMEAMRTGAELNAEPPSSGGQSAEELLATLADLRATVAAQAALIAELHGAVNEIRRPDDLSTEPTPPAPPPRTVFSWFRRLRPSPNQPAPNTNSKRGTP